MQHYGLWGETLGPPTALAIEKRRGNGETAKTVYDEARLKCMLKCIFSLSEEEAQVLSYLITRREKAIVKDIAESLGRNPEVVRRALRKLHAKSLVARRPYPLRKGGRAYIYEVREEVIDIVSSVCEQAKTALTLVGLGEEAARA